MASEWYDRQLKNRNYLSPIGFRLNIQKAPKVSFLCQQVSIPQMELGTVEVNYMGYASVPYEGNIKYGDFSVEFLVDENLENYLELHDWMVGLGVPTTQDERSAFVEDMRQMKKYKDFDEMQEVSDADLFVMNNNLQTNFQVKFIDMFPVSLAPLAFDVTSGDNNYFTCTATFRYNYYEFIQEGEEGYVG
jgi:hypothetical protein